MVLPAFLHPFSRPAAGDFISIVRGEGAIVEDDRGRQYIDAMASLWYCNVGHGRSEIADAVGRQLRQLDAFHTFELFTNPRADEVCEVIAALSPVPDARVFLCDSGSEAVDTALKLVRLVAALSDRPERTVVVAREHAYHGVTYGGMSAQGLPLNKAGFGPLLADVRHVGAHDLDQLAAVLAESGDRVAAVIVEPVIGAGGVFPPDAGYLEGVRRLCDQSGALLVFDEVITGFGRLGSWFGATHYGVTPDLVTFAKAVTSGYQPLGGVLVGRRVREALESDPDFVLRHGFTYSGHPAACAAALANLAIIGEENLLDRASRIGERLASSLGPLVDDGLAGEVRGVGGIWGVGMPAGVDAATVRDAMLDRGVIPRPIGAHTVAFCPPLVITDAQLDWCVEVLREALVSEARRGRR